MTGPWKSILTLIALAGVLAMAPLGAQSKSQDVESEDITETRPATAEEKEEFAKAIVFGKRFSDIGDYRASLEQYLEADAIFADQPGVLFNLAVLFVKQGRFADAQTRVERYLGLYPNGAEAETVRKLGLELDFQKEVEKRQQETKNYIELFNRGRFHMTRGEFDQALRIFQEVAQQRPSDPAVAYNQAVAFEQTGELEEATEQLRRYLELSQNPADKNEIDQKLFHLESEVSDMRTRFVCAFCGYKLPLGTTWCHRCWHGPYLFDSPQWNSRPCVTGASATRTLFFLDGRFGGNEVLACTLKGGSFGEVLQYSAEKQRAIREARKAEGWTYDGEYLSEKKVGEQKVIVLEQGDGYLERLLSPSTGDVLLYSAEAAGEGQWNLVREDVIYDGIKFVKGYTYDPNGRIAQEKATYVNRGSCDHVIESTADYVWADKTLQSVKLAGGYTGFPYEGMPVVSWSGTLGFTYDDKGRVAKEELVLASFTKTYNEKAKADQTRDEIKDFYPGMKFKKPIDIMRTGDFCGTNGTTRLGNRVDLRPFYTVSPSFATLLPYGVTRMTVDYAYPDAYFVK